MIWITDNDFPITAADKIIHGTKMAKASLLDKVVYNAMAGKECNDYVEKDMFDDDELRQIAYHILVYLHGAPVVWKQDIDKMPTIEERKAGTWTMDGFCTICGEEAITEWNDCGGELAFTKYCPNCGAKMSRHE